MHPLQTLAYGCEDPGQMQNVSFRFHKRHMETEKNQGKLFVVVVVCWGSG